MHLRFNLRFKIQDLRLYYSTAHLFIYCDLILNYANFFIINFDLHYNVWNNKGLEIFVVISAPNAPKS